MSCLKDIMNSRSWDACAAYFFDFNRRYSYFHDVNETLLRHVRLRDGMSVLDLGCGTGSLANAVLAKGRRVAIIGVDFSKRMLDYAKLNTENVEFYQQNINHGIRISRAAFDVVASISFWYFNNKQAIIRDVHRLLKAGGLLCLAIPLRSGPSITVGVAKLAREFGLRPAARGIRDRKRRFKVPIASLTRGKFQIVKQFVRTFTLSKDAVRDLNLMPHVSQKYLVGPYARRRAAMMEFFSRIPRRHFHESWKFVILKKVSAPARSLSCQSQQ